LRVSFFTSTGHLANPTAVTDIDGSASDFLTIAAGTPPSSINVSAHTSGGSQSASVAVANLGAITLSSSPTFLSCPSGGSAAGAVQALALDSANRPIPGVTMAFSSDGGSVSPLATTDGTGNASSSVSV